jgi:hypothetical protein
LQKESKRMLLQKIKVFLKSVYSSLKNIYSQIFEQSLNEKINKRFLLIYFSTIFSILFFLTFYLIKKNPLSLLVPFGLFDLPEIEHRVEKSIFIIDGKDTILKVKRKILIKGYSTDQQIDIYISELSNPPFEDKLDSVDATSFPKKTINLKNPLISKWLLDNDSKLIFDFNESSINEELSKIRSKAIVDDEETIFDKKTPEEEKILLGLQEDIQRIKLKKLELAFTCLEKTIFENVPSVQTIEFRLNGRKKTILNLSYDLEKIRTR